MTLKSKIFGIIFAIFILCTIPFQTEGKELEGEACAPSGSSFEVKVLYYLDGGIQNSCNAETYACGSGSHRLYAPYRYGYRFAGWYTDKDMHKRLKEIPTDKKKTFVLYAKWAPKINNRYNVKHYSYTEKENSKNTLLLKNIKYSFWNEIDIPGMPETKEEDFLNKYIFSEAQCPQGLCLTDEFVLITSYSSESGCMGALMVFDRESGEYLITLGMDENSHLGGIAFDGDNVWVCNSNESTIERISYDFIELMAYQNKGDVVDARDVVDEYRVKNSPSCITYYGGRLWVATHTLIMNSKMVAYYYDTSEDKLSALSDYKIPDKVQGITFDDSGRVYLSTSYGRSRSSYLMSYASVTELATRPQKPSLKVEMPPCSEEIDFRDDTLYILFESAGEKYYAGTDGKGTSLSPLDKILMIPVGELD